MARVSRLSYLNHEPNRESANRGGAGGRNMQFKTISVADLKRLRDTVNRNEDQETLIEGDRFRLDELVRVGYAAICAEYLRQNPPEPSQYDDDPAIVGCAN